MASFEPVGRTAWRRGRNRPRCAGEEGTAILEAAIVAPVFFLFIFAIFEFGLLYFSSQTVTNGSTSIARTAAIMGSDLAADYEIVQAAKASMASVPDARIERIVIFYATGPNSTVPAACKTGPSSTVSKCNVYTPSPHFSDSLDAEDFDCSGDGYARFWCPTTRKTALQGSNGPPDYLGIYIEYEHAWVTGLFGDSVTVSETKITKLEPTSVI